MLEFLVTGDPLDWRPLAQVTIWFRNGKRESVLVIPPASTTPGTIDPGSLVRLALQIDAALAQDVAEIVMICGEGILRITL
ncbi:MAG: hypothetical protein HYS34_06885 [Acidobacteria bacterium]|nr:hypothetical protein [Acidobacteriota bacterium]